MGIQSSPPASATCCARFIIQRSSTTPTKKEFNYTYDEKDSEAELLLIIQGVQTIDESGTAGFVERTVDPETKAWSHSRGSRPVSIPIPEKDFETEEVNSRIDQAYILFDAKPSETAGQWTAHIVLPAQLLQFEPGLGRVPKGRRREPKTECEGTTVKNEDQYEDQVSVKEDKIANKDEPVERWDCE